MRLCTRLCIGMLWNEFINQRSLMGTPNNSPDLAKAEGPEKAGLNAADAEAASQQAGHATAVAEGAAAEAVGASEGAGTNGTGGANGADGANPPPPQADFWRTLRLKTLMWRAIALLFMGLGFAGVVLPVMPHVPFFLVALWAAGKGWPELERWLLRHPTFGPQLSNWKERKAISKPVKIVTTLMMLGSAVSMQFFGDLPMWLRMGAPCFMLMGIIFMWTRPDA